MTQRTFSWPYATQITPRTYTCGYCDRVVGPDLGYQADNDSNGRIYICSYCRQPSYFYGNEQTPGVAFGEDVHHLPADVMGLYTEARKCMSVSSYTAAVLTCRKILMNVAVSKSAKEGEAFIDYVTFLADNHYVPPGGKGWVDHIRKKGNEANHEIKLMSRNDAEELISFIEMLLKFVYEFPARIQPAAPPGTTAAPP